MTYDVWRTSLELAAIARAISGPTEEEKNKARLNYFKERIPEWISIIKKMGYNSDSNKQKISSLYLDFLEFTKIDCKNNYNIYARNNPFNEDQIIICRDCISNDAKYRYDLWLVEEKIFKSYPQYIYNFEGSQINDFYTDEYLNLINNNIEEFCYPTCYPTLPEDNRDTAELIKNGVAAFLIGFIVILLLVVLPIGIFCQVL